MDRALDHMEGFLENMSRELDEWKSNLPTAFDIEIETPGSHERQPQNSLPAVLMLL
jgi:hypothetical protein